MPNLTREYPPPKKLLIKEDKSDSQLPMISPASSDDPVEGSIETIEAAEEHEEEKLRKQKSARH